jgi:hypothetical protein
VQKQKTGTSAQLARLPAPRTVSSDAHGKNARDKTSFAQGQCAPGLAFRLGKSRIESGGFHDNAHVVGTPRKTRRNVSQQTQMHKDGLCHNDDRGSSACLAPGARRTARTRCRSTGADKIAGARIMKQGHVRMENAILRP